MSAVKNLLEQLFEILWTDGIPVFHEEDGELHCKLIDAQGNDLIPFEMEAELP